MILYNIYEKSTGAIVLFGVEYTEFENWIYATKQIYNKYVCRRMK